MEKSKTASSKQINELNRGLDSYLDEQQHSEEAYERVQKALNTFDFMVQLAVSRALQEVYGEKPYDDETDHEATILEFPMERIKPPKNTTLKINHNPKTKDQTPFWIE